MNSRTHVLTATNLPTPPRLTDQTRPSHLLQRKKKWLTASSYRPSSDNISCALFLSGRAAIAPLLLNLFATSMPTGIFPVYQKVSAIAPLHSNGPLCDPKNYRLMNQIPILVRRTETTVMNQLIDYLTTNDITGESKYGFLKCVPRISCHFEFFIWSF